MKWPRARQFRCGKYCSWLDSFSQGMKVPDENSQDESQVGAYMRSTFLERPVKGSPSPKNMMPKSSTILVTALLHVERIDRTSRPSQIDSPVSLRDTIAAI